MCFRFCLTITAASWRCPELVKLQSELGFSVDKVAKEVVVTVKRKESGEIVRQIPSETVLKLAHNFEKLKGMLLDKTF